MAVGFSREFPIRFLTGFPMINLRAGLDGLLAPDESLQGWCLGTEQTTFSGHTTILGITDQRLVLQAVDRKFRPKDDALSIRPDELTTADAEGAGSK